MRVEILNGLERRRRWSDSEKARITEETFAPGAKVSEVARKHGVSRSLIFAWRREARAKEHDERAAAHLIPRRPDCCHQAPPAQNPRHSTRSTEKKTGLIEIDLGEGNGYASTPMLTPTRSVACSMSWGADDFVPRGVRVWLMSGHTDMRKGFGLALLVQESLKRNPYDGNLIYF